MQRRSDSKAAVSKPSPVASPSASRRGSRDSQRSSRRTSLSLSRRPSTDSLARELEAQMRSPAPAAAHTQRARSRSPSVRASTRRDASQERALGEGLAAVTGSAQTRVSRNDIDRLIGSVPPTSISPETVLVTLEAQAALLQYFKNIVMVILTLVQTGQLPRGLLPDSAMGDLVKKMNNELNLTLAAVDKAKLGANLVMSPQVLKQWIKRLLGYYLLVGAFMNPYSQEARNACLNEPIVMSVLTTEVNISFDDTI